jgi:CcmD family protein
MLSFIVNQFLNFILLQDVEMADTFRKDGKIWVVVAVIAVSFIGLFAYLFSMDRKLTKIEKKMKDSSTQN